MKAKFLVLSARNTEISFLRTLMHASQTDRRKRQLFMRGALPLAVCGLLLLVWCFCGCQNSIAANSTSDPLRARKEYSRKSQSDLIAACESMMGQNLETASERLRVAARLFGAASNLTNSNLQIRYYTRAQELNPTNLVIVNWTT